LVIIYSEGSSWSGISGATRRSVKTRSAEEITQLLARWSDGDATALDRLMPLVYDELHKLARASLRRDRLNRSMQPTALVHEAYLRLVAQGEASWASRVQFFGMAAKLMRNILVDYARQHLAAKRGGQQYRVSFAEAERIGTKPDVDLIALDDALKELSTTNPEHSRVVELRFFGGLTIEETAEVLDLSHATVEREWNFARAWLRRELSK
jgi:RNA polymerase sigma-70 factor (ECF subfamily)